MPRKIKRPVVQISVKGHRGLIAVNEGDDAKEVLMAYFANTLMPNGGKASVKGTKDMATLTFKDNGKTREYIGIVCS